MTYKDIGDWVAENYDLQDYGSPEKLIEQVKLDWFMQNINFPTGAEDSIKEKFVEFRTSMAYTDPIGYEKLQRNLAEKQMVDEMIGNAMVSTSLSEEIIDDMRRPEIMGTSISGISDKPVGTTPEEVIQGKRGGFFSKLTSGFKSFFGRKKK